VFGDRALRIRGQGVRISRWLLVTAAIFRKKLSSMVVLWTGIGKPSMATQSSFAWS
jgi:hypothetical protein